MSIYLYLKELENLTKGFFKAPLFPDIIVYEKETLDPLITSQEENIEKKLLEISDNRNICINHNFWNYKINNYNQLSLKFTEKMEDKIKVLIENVKSSGFGLFLNHILFHDILTNIYKLNQGDFQNMLDRINIDRNVISNLMIEYNYHLPINYNYFLLLKRVFCDFKILDLIFNHQSEECFYTCDQIISILEEIDFGDINFAYFKITSHTQYSLENKLEYLKCLLQVYDNKIDQDAVIYYSVKNPKFSLTFYLMNLDVQGPITDLYYEVLNLSLAKGSARKVIVIDDAELNNKLSKRIFI